MIAKHPIIGFFCHPRVCGDPEINRLDYRLHGNDKSSGWPSHLSKLLAMTCLFLILPLNIYATSESIESLENDGDVFRSRNVDLDNGYNAFDLLNDNERYKNDEKNKFDVTEGNEEQEENYTPPPTATQVTKEAIVEKDGSYHSIARIVAINKITARSKELSIKVGTSSYFGNIEIMVAKCWYNENPYSPSYRILTKVLENKIDEDTKYIFEGWLISSNIPVSGLEDPAYELIAIDCYDGI